MRKIYTLLFFLSLCSYAYAQQTFPINGIKDSRESYFAFSNATVFTDYQTKIENATLIIRNGLVEAVGSGLAVPKGATEINLNGKYIYPSLIDLYSDYGLPPVQRATPNFFEEQYESKKKGSFNWNQAVQPERNAEELFLVDEKTNKDLIKLGFGALLVHLPDGLVRGTGVLVSPRIAKANEVILLGRASTHFSLDKGSSTQSYPNSLMGFIALIRQTFLDADWYQKSTDKKEYNISLEAFNKNKSLPAIFESRNKLTTLRADKIGDEFGVQYIIKGTGDEYQRINEIKAMNAALIIPVNFPEAFDVSDPLEANNISLTEMKHWELAPTNASALAKAGISFAFTAAGLKNKTDFMKNIQKAIEYGLDEKEALKALTFNPALLIKASDKLGSLKKGMIANFLISSGNLFDKENILYESWIQGFRQVINPTPPSDIRGVYDLTVGNQSGLKLTISGKADKPTYLIEKTSDSLKTNPTVARADDLVSLTYKLAKKGETVGNTQLSGWVKGKTLKGTGLTAEGQTIQWSAIYKTNPPADTTKQPKREDKKLSLGNIIYPFVAYGNEKMPVPENVLIKNATVWTNESEGIVKETDVLIQNGRIAKIGKNLNAAGAKVLDGTGKHLTPGIIDEHSHNALLAINEGGQSNTAEVRMADAVNSEDIDIYRQLAGGVTAAQLLHGSANAIGGQSALVKFKWGEAPEKLLIPNAEGFIKFALGENPKRGNSGFGGIRYPQTRMGVEQVFEDAFTQAKEYKNAKLTKGTNLRKDLELEAMAEILDKKRFITCHSYVQSEINMLMKLADRHNFTVNTFTHILEGYKVADKMKSHGAGGSSFADWWAYKFEVKDAIPHNATILNRMGVVTAINSDDAEMARRLNQEAAKTVKYGGTNEEDALKMVTLNPAKLLHLDKRMGSIKEGKDADLVLWTDNPLSIYAVVDKTLVDGAIYFDAEKDAQMREQIKKERARLIQKMLDAKSSGEPAKKPIAKARQYWHCCEDMIDRLAETEGE